MSLCAFCGHPTGHPGGLCGHHSAGHGDGWARGNRLMCDLLHRGITSSRPHQVDRLDSETSAYVDLPGRPWRSSVRRENDLIPRRGCAVRTSPVYGMSRLEPSDKLCELFGCAQLPDGGAWSHRLACPRHHAATCANCRELEALRRRVAAADRGAAI